MIKRKISLTVLLLVCLYCTKCILKPEDTKSPTSKLASKLYPFEDYFLEKQYPQTSVSIAAYNKALEDVKRFSQNSNNRFVGEWKVQGPGNIGARVNCLAIDPNDDKKMFAGFSEGGLFRTLDGGVRWQPVFDEQTRLTIGDIKIDPSNTDIIYVGTGDPNISGYPFIGNGLYKSIDGGDTWTNVGLGETSIISKIEVSTTNSNILYVATMGLPFEKNSDRGLYKSLDGGASWDQILFINDSTGVSDMVIHPNDHNIVFAAGWNRIRNNKESLVSGPDARIFKSVDGGSTWEILTNGLPTDNSSRIGIAISASNPNVLYACYAAATDFNLKGIFRSEDAGESWLAMPIDEDSGMNPQMYSGFGWYFGKIRVNPNDENDVFILGVDMFRSRNGGQNWAMAVPPWWTYEVHADKHELIFQNDKMYLGTDGGVYASDIQIEQWIDIENIPTTQFYRVGYNPHKPDFYYGGAQDNGTCGGNAADVNDWERIYGGDGFQCVFDPIDPDVFYVETQNGNIVVTTNGGLSYNGATFGINASDPRNWDMPYIMSSHDPNILYCGTNKIYKNITGPNVEWVAISDVLTDENTVALRKNITSISEDPTSPGTIIAGTSDGKLWLTPDDGQTWKDISAGLPGRYISSVAISQVGLYYVTFSGYKDNDNTPYIFQSTDKGNNWVGIQGDLPFIAINNVLVLPPDDDLIEGDFLVATDGGVFYGNGIEWKRLGDNFPFVAVYDLEYNPVNNEVIAGTYGRSIQTFDLYQVGYGYVDTKDIDNIFASFDLSSTVVNQSIDIVFSQSWNQTSQVKFGIYSRSGALVKSGLLTKNGNSAEIEIAELPSGIYFIQCMNKGRWTSKKFLKI